MSATPEINRANSQHSTGPQTEAGKQRSSLNALRHGLTSQIVVMPNEDIEAYRAHLKSFTSLTPPGASTEDLDAALDIMENCESKGEAYRPSDDGFVFSQSQISRAIHLRKRQRAAVQTAA